MQEIQKKMVLFRSLRDARLEHDKLSAEIKKREDAIAVELLMSLEAAGVQNIKFPGIGTLAKRERETIFISDMKALSNFVHSIMTSPDSDETARLDAMSLLQTRAHQSNIAKLLESGVAPETLGVTVKKEASVSITKAD